MTDTDRKLATARGWARFLSRLPELRETLDRMTHFRVADGASTGTGQWGVLVNDDRWALQYQRLTFRENRALYAIGEYGLKGKAQFTGSGETTIELAPGVVISGWTVASAAEVNAENQASLHRHHRSKAAEAKRKLAAMGVGFDPRTDVQIRMHKQAEDEMAQTGYY